LRLAGLAANNLAVLKPATYPLLYVIPLLGIVASFLLILRRARLRRGSAWVERLVDANVGAAGRVRSLFGARRHAAPSRA
jgi:hypothetical protein